MEVMGMFLFFMMIAAVLSAVGRAVWGRFLPKDHEGRDTALWQVTVFPFASALWFGIAVLALGDPEPADLGDGLKLHSFEGDGWLNDEKGTLLTLTAIQVTQKRLFFANGDTVYGVMERATRRVEFVSGLDALKAKAREAGIELRLEDPVSEIHKRNGTSPIDAFALAVPLVAGLAFMVMR